MRLLDARWLRPLAVLALAAALPAAVATSVSVGAPTAQAAPPEAVQAITLDELLQGFAAMPGLEASFRQESRFALLAAPLVDTGTLHFAQGKLARRTLEPAPSVVIMDSGGIEYGDGNQSERIDLEGKPAVRQFVDAFTRIFAGDRPGLEALYQMQFQVLGEDGREWALILVPKVSPMNQIIERVEVHGSELTFSELRVYEKGGDESITTFSKVDTKRRYTEAELGKLFSTKL